MQNSTYTTTKTRCSHTGISAVFSGADSAGCAGLGFSRFVGVDFKGPEIFDVRCNYLDAIEDSMLLMP